MSSSCVLKVEVVSIDDRSVTLNMRVRGDNRWLFFENVTMGVNTIMALTDGEDMEKIPDSVAFSALSRSDTIDEMIERYG